MIFTNLEKISLHLLLFMPPEGICHYYRSVEKYNQG